ncbi:MAG: ExsB family transcriptional regulator [Eggerthellaceae bacterium]|nr:ExsB family transcriptional regulator [Eggerthellaceae bacterium]
MPEPNARNVAKGQLVGVEPLADFFACTPRFALAFSGGTDSAYLLAAAVGAGCEVSAYCVKTQFQPDFELEDAQRVLGDIAVRRPLAEVSFHVLECDVMAHDDICANPPERCYLCKRFIMGAIRHAMVEEGLEVLVDGTNASDDPARRPGFRALAELGVFSPLRRAGMTKDDIRAASRALGVGTADKPSFSCLATAVPQGVPITLRSLARAAAERGVDDGKRPWDYGTGAAPSALQRNLEGRGA